MATAKEKVSNDASIKPVVESLSTFFKRGDVGAEVDVPERSRADLPAEAILVAHPELHGGCLDLDKGK